MKLNPLSHFGRIAGMTSREIDAKMDEIAEFTGLGPFLAMPVKTYSAGMQGRLAFAAATAVEADVLLMDEGFCVIEGNASAGCVMFQMDGGVRDGEIGDIYRSYGIIK